MMGCQTNTIPTCDHQLVSLYRDIATRCGNNIIVACLITIVNHAGLETTTHDDSDIIIGSDANYIDIIIIYGIS